MAVEKVAGTELEAAQEGCVQVCQEGKERNEVSIARAAEDGEQGPCMTSLTGKHLSVQMCVHCHHVGLFVTLVCTVLFMLCWNPAA